MNNYSKSTEIRDFALGKDRDGLTTRQIKEAIQEQFNSEVSMRTIQRRKKKYSELQEMSQETEGDVKFDEYEKDGEIYVAIHTKKKSGTPVTYNLPMETVNEIQYMYTSSGANMSSKKIAREMSVDHHVVMTVLKRMDIYKDSHIVNDLKIKELEEEGGEEAVHEYIDHRVESGVIDKYKNKYRESRNHHVEKQGIKALKRLGEIEGVIDFVEENVKKWGIPAMDPVEIIEPKNGDSRISSITDLHIGKNNTSRILSKIDEITSHLINCPESTVYRECLGDLGEIFIEGGRHPGQIEGMEGPYGFDLIMLCAETLATNVNELSKHKLVKFIGIGGNHDVFSTAKGGDSRRTAALCIYQIVKERLANNPNVEVIIPKDVIYVYDVGNFRNIIGHGDFVMKQGLERVIIEYGDLNKFNVVKYGHKHYLDIEDKNSKGMMIGVPGLAGQGSYDKQLGLSASTGFLDMYKNPFGSKPTFQHHLMD